MSKKGKKAEKTTAEGGDGLSGVFCNDFPIYCIQNGLPPVLIRTLPRSEAPPTGNAPPSPAKDATSSTSSHCVLVETDTVDSHTPKKIHIRNLLLDERVMSALTSALYGTQLATLSLWNVGLSEVTLNRLPLLVTGCNMRRLVLDGNQVAAQHIISILQSTSLEQLSLKCCCLGDAFCAAIHSTLAANRVLIALDLSSNQITDHGLAQLANALRLNRTLLSLCLAGNRIGDDGVIALCQVLVKFPLTKDEELARKSLMATTVPAYNDGGMDSIGRSPSTISLDKDRSGRGSRGTGGRGKGKDLKKDDKEKSGRSSATGRAGKGSKVGIKKVKGDEKEDPQQGASGGGGSKEPLVELVREEDGRLWMQGNSTLAHLTLSCNRVGVRGVASLLEVLQVQQVSSPSPMTSDPWSPDKLELCGTGLLRVTLQHNGIPVNCAELVMMTSLLQSCDPLATPPSPQLQCP